MNGQKVQGNGGVPELPFSGCQASHWSDTHSPLRMDRSSGTGPRPLAGQGPHRLKGTLAVCRLSRTTLEFLIFLVRHVLHCNWNDWATFGFGACERSLKGFPNVIGLPCLSVVDMHSLPQCWPLLHLLHVPEG